MPSYKLHYFKATGRAETARMIFALKGVKFEDIRYSSEEWQKVKAGQLVLTVTMRQQNLLCNFVANQVLDFVILYANSFHTVVTSTNMVLNS